MIANVTHYTTGEGGPWFQWPWANKVKPSNPILLTLPNAPTVTLRMPVAPRAYAVIEVHALKFDNGRIWDSLNNWRDGGGPN